MPDHGQKQEALSSAYFFTLSDSVPLTFDADMPDHQQKHAPLSGASFLTLSISLTFDADMPDGGQKHENLAGASSVGKGTSGDGVVERIHEAALELQDLIVRLQPL